MRKLGPGYYTSGLNRKTHDCQRPGTKWRKSRLPGTRAACSLLGRMAMLQDVLLTTPTLLCVARTGHPRAWSLHSSTTAATYTYTRSSSGMTLRNTGRHGIRNWAGSLDPVVNWAWHDLELPALGDSHHQLPIREGPMESTLPRGGALHRLQALRGHPPIQAITIQVELGPGQWQPPDHPQHRDNQVHLLQLLLGSLLSGWHGQGHQVWVLHGDTGGDAVQQRKDVQQQGQVGDLRHHPGWPLLSVTLPTLPSWPTDPATQ